MIFNSSYEESIAYLRNLSGYLFRLDLNETWWTMVNKSHPVCCAAFFKEDCTGSSFAFYVSTHAQRRETGGVRECGCAPKCNSLELTIFLCWETGKQHNFTVFFILQRKLGNLGKNSVTYVIDDFCFQQIKKLFKQNQYLLLR